MVTISVDVYSASFFGIIGCGVLVVAMVHTKPVEKVFDWWFDFIGD